MGALRKGMAGLRPISGVMARQHKDSVVRVAWLAGMVWTAALWGRGLTLDPQLPGVAEGGVSGGGGVGVVMFNKLEEATLVEAGSWYFEQALTGAFRTKSDRAFSEHVLQTAVYYSPTDRFTLAAFLADVSYTSSAEFDGMRYEGSGLQGLLTLVDPESSPVGVAVYSFVGANERGFGNDTRLVLQHLRVGWNFAYNLRLGTEVSGWDGGGTETTGVLGHTFGAAYGWEREGWVPEASLGLELLVDSVYGEWQRYKGTSVYAGPTLGLVLGGRAALTVTGLVQLTDEDSPRLAVQVTLGWGF